MRNGGFEAFVDAMMRDAMMREVRRAEGAVNGKRFKGGRAQHPAWTRAARIDPIVVERAAPKPPIGSAGMFGYECYQSAADTPLGPPPPGKVVYDAVTGQEWRSLIIDGPCAR